MGPKLCFYLRELQIINLIQLNLSTTYVIVDNNDIGP